MIDEGSHWNLRHQLRHSAGVVHVVMREQHVVDALKPRSFRSGGDTLGITSFGARPARIDQQGMLVGCHE